MVVGDTSLQMQRLKGGLSAFRFFSDNIMVISNGYSESLELFTFPKIKCDTGRITMVKAAILHLLDMRHRISDLQVVNHPAKNGVTCRNRQFDNAVSHVKPFICLTNNIICVPATVYIKLVRYRAEPNKCHFLLTGRHTVCT